eukprot:g5625.t1
MAISSINARGSAWVARVEGMVNMADYEDEETYKQYMARCPYAENSRSLLRRIYRLYSTSSVEVVSKFVGIEECPVNEETKMAVDCYVRNVLTRGNVGGRVNDNFRTNESFLRRQADFLEFMEMHPELKSSFDDLTFITKRTKEDLSNFTWRLSPNAQGHSFVSEAAAIAYIDCKDEQKRAHKEVLHSELKGVIDLTSLEEQQEGQRTDEDEHSTRDSKRRRMNIQNFVSCI